MKEKKKAIRTLKKQQTDTNDKKAEKKRLEEQLKAIKTEVKAEKTKAKQDVVIRPKGSESASVAKMTTTKWMGMID